MFAIVDSDQMDVIGVNCRCISNPLKKINLFVHISRVFGVGKAVGFVLGHHCPPGAHSVYLVLVNIQIKVDKDGGDLFEVMEVGGVQLVHFVIVATCAWSL